MIVFFLMIRRPPRSTRTDTLFPYTTLFRSLAAHPLISYDSSNRPDSSLQRAFAGEGVQPQVAMTARDANLIKTYVRAGLGAGLLAEMALGTREDADLQVLPAPAALPESINRSEERRVGEECVIPFRSRWLRYH